MKLSTHPIYIQRFPNQEEMESEWVSDGRKDHSNKYKVEMQGHSGIDEALLD